MLNNNTVSKYVDAITAEAQQAKADAEQKIADYKAQRISDFKRNAKNESKAEIARQTAVIHEDIGRDFSDKEIALRQQIFIKREEIKNEVFALAEEKLAEFTKTPEYKDFLINSVNEIKQNLAGTDKVITVYIRECDLTYKSDIEQAFSFPCDFQTDGTIKIGGIRAKFSKIILDDTLDSRLFAQTDWFEENSGLDIK